MEDEVGRLRCILATSTQKRKSQVENVRTVHVCVETRSNNPKRIKGTRHIDFYTKTKKYYKGVMGAGAETGDGCSAGTTYTICEKGEMIT
jgi:hypothetical protein